MGRGGEAVSWRTKSCWTHALSSLGRWMVALAATRWLGWKGDGPMLEPSSQCLPRLCVSVCGLV